MLIREKLRAIFVVLLVCPLVALADDPKPDKSNVTKPPAATVPITPKSPAAVTVPVVPRTTVGAQGLPGPIERTRALARVGLQPTNLQSDLAVTYSAEHLADNDGELGARYVDLSKRDGRWVLYNRDHSGPPAIRPEVLPGPAQDSHREDAREYEAGPGSVSVTFRTRVGQRYLVDFALDSNAQLDVRSGTAQTLQGAIDGHLPIIVVGAGARQSVSVFGEGFTFYYVRVIPIE